VDNDFTILLDPENPDTILLPNVMTLEEKAFRGSRLELKPPADPREHVVHDENDEAFLHRHLDYYVLRLRANTKVSKSVLIANNEEYGASVVYETGFEKIFEPTSLRRRSAEHSPTISWLKRQGRRSPMVSTG